MEDSTIVSTHAPHYPPLGVKSRPATILVGDTYPGIISMFKKMLDHFGYRIVVATSGAEASTAFVLHRPDAIILDIYLPDLAEFDVCTAVRSRCGVPIILMTGGDLEMNTHALASLRSDYILNKPFGITELRDSIRACLLARRS